MKKLVLTSKDLNNLEKLPLVEGTVERESIMYYSPEKEREVLKVYQNYDNKIYIMEKLRNARNLLTYLKKEDFPELLRPLGIVYLDDKIIGTIYSEKYAYTARTYLSLNIINIKIKVEMLRRIGMLLEKIKHTNPEYNAAFADVHTDNFLVDDIVVDKDRNINHLSIVACDTDSMKIKDSKGNPAYYLYDGEKLSEFDKYRLDADKIIIPDSNTDIYCYIMIILDFISKSNYTYCLNVNEYNRYLDYLDSLGVDHNLLRSFASVYDNDIDNISPLPYLNALYNIGDNATLQSFYKRKKE